MTTVKCNVCKLPKDSTEDFYWSKGKRMLRCKECHKEYVKLWRKYHKDEVLAHRKKYNTKYRERKKREIDS